MSERNASPPEELESAMRYALDNNPTPTAPEVLAAAEMARFPKNVVVTGWS